MVTVMYINVVSARCTYGLAYRRGCIPYFRGRSVGRSPTFERFPRTPLPSFKADITTNRQPGQHRLAWTLNMLINPLTAAPVLMGLIATHAGASSDTVLSVVLTAAAGYTVLPLALLSFMRVRGQIRTIEARDQGQRSRALKNGLVLLCVAGLACWAVADDVQRSVAIVSLVLILHLSLAIFITPRLKVSLHVAAVSGMFSILLMQEWLSGIPMPLSPWIYAMLLVLLPIMMWARVADGAHSRTEVTAGLFFGLFLPPLLIWILEAMLPL
jgi:hypothetical protein